MAKRGCTVVAAGHEVRELLAIADQVVWMTAGTTHGLGAPDDARRHPRFRGEYLGPAGGL
jgi:ABC-type sulfate/molybdate transport systems ATPase subunit